jgi:hypothetical protein
VTGGATNNQDCASCDAGFYCADASQPRPDGPCTAGYYCTSGSKTPNQTITKAGYFTPAGSSEAQPCQPGFYNPYEKQSQCFPCDAGYYCPTNKMMNKSICPEGYYCPEGSHRTYACPPGTFNNYTGGSSLNDSCKSCPTGWFCQGAANLLPEGWWFQ